MEFTSKEIKDIDTSIQSALAHTRPSSESVPSSATREGLQNSRSFGRSWDSSADVSALVMPTQSRAKVEKDLEHDDSLISMESEDESWLAGTTKARSRGLHMTDSGPYMESSRVSRDDLKTQVWLYAHGKQKRIATDRAELFLGHIDKQKKNSFPFLTRAKKRILRAVQGMHSREEDEIWSEQQQVDLTETSFCARRLKEYIERKMLPVPAFLEPCDPPSKSSLR
jgi:hypothetical protein